MMKNINITSGGVLYFYPGRNNVLIASASSKSSNLTSLYLDGFVLVDLVSYSDYFYL
jgi:hypothetical protein